MFYGLLRGESKPRFQKERQFPVEPKKKKKRVEGEVLNVFSWDKACP